MEQNKKTPAESRKFRVEIDIPYLYHEALVNNPLVGEEMMRDKAQKAVMELFTRMYNNPRVVAEPLKRYLEAKLGAPTASKKKRKQTEETPADEQEEPLQEETTPAEEGNNGSW